MSRLLLINTLVILAVTAHARSQYIDFFQSFSTFIQPYTTRRPDITKRPSNKQINKQFQDTIFFETDDFVKQKESGRIDPFTTTSKPRRKPKTTRKPTTSWYQANDKSKNNQVFNPSNNRRTDSDYNNIFNFQVATTQKPYYTAKPVRPVQITTINPLLNRPGVRPAVVDDNRPPITNRPVTSRPYQLDDDDGAAIEIGPDEDAMSEAEKRRFIEIAEQKCEEYKSMNKKKVVALPLASIHATQGVELDVSTCTPLNTPLIIGGKVVSIQEFPHMGLVGWKNIQKEGYSWKCGGSLISDQYVLTAGHCTYYDKDYNVISGPPAAVQLGSSYIDGRDSLVVAISSVIRHPKYKVRRSYYDVALIKLETTVTFSESISPACLGVPPAVGNRIIATGWGRTEFGGDSSKELRGVSVSVWDMSECRSVWGTSRKMPDGPSTVSQLCAGARQGGKDTCQGDSGGPAQIQDGCSWRVVAVTSIGRSCGAEETPALYARLPRAFIAAQVFANIKLNNNNQNNNRPVNNNNQNNNRPVNNNNNFGSGVITRPTQPVSNNWNSNNNNQNNNRPVNNNNFGSGVISRPNTQPISSNSNSNNNFGSSQPGYQNDDRTTNQFASSDSDVYRPGNHQTVDNNRRDGGYYNQNSNRGEISRPGNHQTVSNRGNDAVNFFVTSHTTGNRDTVSRLGNHQMVDARRDPSTGNNFFVTSHTSGIRDAVISLPGNHQTIQNNNYNRGSVNRFSDNQNSESSQDAVYEVGENNDNRDGITQNNGYGNTWVNNGQNGQNTYYNTNQNNISQNSRTTQTYTNLGYQSSEYSATEGASYNRNNDNNNGYTVNNNGYNVNNNGYNVNNNGYNVNNDGFAVTNSPWWKR